ncbi:MAG: hypothetical protein H6736_09045 [Alphaproteobacteria bacterium]|nr:hypothetical protein [Alphaproteobacteria bacterium]MCB9691949.1 hypothetical protein [Alphaproteobacteria bacterium]
MNEPRRLREDPELRQAFEDERLALGPHDLAALRARVVAGSPVPATPSGPRWPTLVGISGLTAALVSVALWAILPSGPVIPPPQSTPAPPVLLVGEPRMPTRVAVPGVDTEDPVEPDLPAPAPVVAPVEVGTVQAPEPVETVETPAVPEPAPVDHGLRMTAPRADLQAELEDYNRALDAASASRWSEARERYAAYLEAWPSGRLRDEAQLGLLGALVRSDRPGEAESLATRLLADPALARRAEDIRLLRAEALVELDRCDDALAVLEDVRRSARVTAVRNACRRKR